MATTIPRPDPVPACLHCRADAVGQYEATEGPRPLCEAHHSLSSDWRPYAPEQPIKARPSPSWLAGSRPIAIGTVAEARRLLATLGAVENFDGQVHILTIALDCAYQTGRADALAAKGDE